MVQGYCVDLGDGKVVLVSTGKENPARGREKITGCERPSGFQ